jgi:uncharacterized protein YoxC
MEQSAIPTWWLVLSGAFFALNIAFFAILAWVLLKLVQLVVALQPKLNALETSVQSLVEKVNVIAENVEDLTATVKSTVSDVSGNAKVVASNAQIVSQTATREFERYASLVMGAVSVFKLFRAFGDMRSKKRAAESGKGNALGAILLIAQTAATFFNNRSRRGG